MTCPDTYRTYSHSNVGCNLAAISVTPSPNWTFGLLTALEFQYVRLITQLPSSSTFQTIEDSSFQLDLQHNKVKLQGRPRINFSRYLGSRSGVFLFLEVSRWQVSEQFLYFYFQRFKSCGLVVVGCPLDYTVSSLRSLQKVDLRSLTILMLLFC